MTENLSLSGANNDVLTCMCSICMCDADKLHIFKNGLVCDDCIEYVQTISSNHEIKKPVVN